MNIWAIIVPLFIFIAVVGTGTYVLRDLFIPTDQTIPSSPNQPSKTYSSNGYVEQKGKEAAVGSIAIVDDAGVPEWVKVPSKVNLDKFTDLSTNGITIYRINNPEVLKTVTNRTDQRMKMSEVVAKYPNALIMNASAFDMQTGQVAGFQINNGKLIQDWSPGTTTQYAFVINKDGSCKIYDSSTPASTIIKNGGQQAYDFGTAIIRDGKIQPSDGSVDWKIHIFIANDKDNNLYAILSDTNAGYNNIMKSVSNLKLQNMLLLDSGGSSQLSVNGKTIVASQDDRAVPDYIVMK
ncbi:phosphodiester glycosidase family protein [Lactococcus lactis]|uniref:phosphodiester glycosidase family protein n=1 Tax=Lactococcus lactis TaxID=1358 RepID=UPI000559B267|nr:phosphodiester glycosidase family protein [Lactococcus lactis]AJA56032.1 exopolysaccharide biosynthesis protein [Lactococcus lactis subsp. lactis]WBM77563.1 phosphodiester glycosidase family protein [Lactococcus lactis]WSP32026.1 phosphodiester glycosidase family protein [Lactococcus lactis subsp. lactis]